MTEGAYLNVACSGLGHTSEDDAEIRRVMLGAPPLDLLWR